MIKQGGSLLLSVIFVEFKICQRDVFVDILLMPRLLEFVCTLSEISACIVGFRLLHRRMANVTVFPGLQ